MSKRGKDNKGIPGDIYVPEVDGCCGHHRERYRHGRDDYHEFGGEDGHHILATNDDQGEHDVPYGFHELHEKEAAKLVSYNPMPEPRTVHCQHCGTEIGLGKALCRACYNELMESLKPHRQNQYDLEEFYDQRHDDCCLQWRRAKAKAKALRAGKRQHAIKDGRVYFEPWHRIVMTTKRRQVRRNRQLLQE